MIILRYHEIFFRLTAPRCPGMAAGAFSLRKSHDIVILSFCKIVKGLQANCIDITKVMTIEVNTKVNIIIVLLNRDVVVLLKSLPSFITRYCIPARNMCVSKISMTVAKSLNILWRRAVQISIFYRSALLLILPPGFRKPCSSSNIVISRWNYLVLKIFIWLKIS